MNVCGKHDWQGKSGQCPFCLDARKYINDEFVADAIDHAMVDLKANFEAGLGRVIKSRIRAQVIEILHTEYDKQIRTMVHDYITMDGLDKMVNRAMDRLFSKDVDNDDPED